jgi:hypothetical protein
MMPSSLIQYHRNNINNINIQDNNYRNTRELSAYYSYNGTKSTYVLFIHDHNNKNIYIETQSVSIIIPYKELYKYNKLHVYYIISLQLTPRNSTIYYCDIGYKGIYKEFRKWYILSNICWKSRYISFGDYCYFMGNPLHIDLSVCDTNYTIEGFLDLFNNNEITEDPYKICDWLINHEINVIANELYQNKLIVNYEKTQFELLQIVKKHFAINDDIIFKIYEYIVFNVNNKIMI